MRAAHRGAVHLLTHQPRGEAKVRELSLALERDQHVVGLEVPVKQPLAVHVGEGRGQLLAHARDARLREVDGRPERLRQRAARHVLHDEPQPVGAKIRLPQAHDGRVRAHLLQGDLVLEGGQLRRAGHLDRDPLARASVAGQEHGAAGAGPDLLLGGENVPGIARRDDGRLRDGALVRGAGGQSGHGAFHVRAESAQHLLRVGGHLLLGDARGRQHRSPAVGEALDRCGGGVHGDVVHPLHVVRRADPQAIGVLLGLGESLARPRGSSCATRQGGVLDLVRRHSRGEHAPPRGWQALERARRAVPLDVEHLPDLLRVRHIRRRSRGPGGTRCSCSGGGRGRAPRCGGVGRGCRRARCKPWAAHVCIAVSGLPRGPVVRHGV
mmetsp:Transcript_15204/g.57373  ORF Transcript_15204/g.57373 Transcript_15204/m.57373 type:complete len:381 (-) Transcript_15204:211-1353(-)